MPSQIITIDAQYLAPQLAAIFLLENGGEVALVETGTAHSLPFVENALAEAGLKPDHVKYIIPTHAHLDHSGGTWAMSQRFGQATVLAHPRAARHIADPARLLESSKRVYGEAMFEKLYGQIEGVPEERIRSMADGESLPLGQSSLTFWHTSGHASHHFVVHDSDSNSVFTGDSFGICYPALQKNGSLFIYPSTTPTEFDPDLARQSIEKIMLLNASSAWLTHFGRLEEIRQAGHVLLEGIDRAENILHAAMKLDQPEQISEFCQKKTDEFFHSELHKRGLKLRDYHDLLRMDIELNAMGIAVAALRRLKKSSDSGKGAGN